MLNKNIDHFVAKMLVISIITTSANFYKVSAGSCFSQPAGNKKEEEAPLLRNNGNNGNNAQAFNIETESAVEYLAKDAARRILCNISVAQAKITEGQFDAANTALKEAYPVIYRSLVLSPNVFEQVSSSVGSPYTSLASAQAELQRLSNIIKEREQADRKQAMAEKLYNDIGSKIAEINITIENLEAAEKQYEDINTLLNTQGENVLNEEQVRNLKQQLEALRTQLTKAEQEKQAKLEEEARIKAEQEKQAKISQAEQTIEQINSNIEKLETVVQEIEQEITTAQLGSTLDGLKNPTFETLKASITDQLFTLQTQIGNLPKESLEYYSEQKQSLFDRFETATSTYSALTADDLADDLVDDIDNALDDLDF